uniref:Uncharacterized protein n=1 Tax=Aegilops tauschii subsp. strangulata TaxID=200361 RepID=A0A453K7H7_AEGTS
MPSGVCLKYFSSTKSSRKVRSEKLHGVSSAAACTCIPTKKRMIPFSAKSIRQGLGPKTGEQYGAPFEERGIEWI